MGDIRDFALYHNTAVVNELGIHLSAGMAVWDGEHTAPVGVGIYTKAS